jgi:hypothetical protein
MVPLIESPKINLGFIKFVQNGLLNNSEQSTSVTVLQSLNSLLNRYRKESHAFLRQTITVKRPESIIMLQKANSRIWNGNIRHRQSKGVQYSTVEGKVMLAFLSDAIWSTLERYQESVTI